MTTNIQDVVAEIAERVATQMNGRTVTSHEHYQSMLKKELEHELTQLVKEVEAGEREKVVKHFEKYLLDWKDGMTENSPTAKISWVVEEIKALTPPTTDKDKVHGVIIGKE